MKQHNLNAYSKEFNRSQIMQSSSAIPPKIDTYKMPLTQMQNPGLFSARNISKFELYSQSNSSNKGIASLTGTNYNNLKLNMSSIDNNKVNLAQSLQIEKKQIMYEKLNNSKGMSNSLIIDLKVNSNSQSQSSYPHPKLHVQRYRIIKQNQKFH